MTASRRRAYLYGLVTVALWSTVASAFKISLRYMGPFQLLFYADMTSTLALGAILAFTSRMRNLLGYPVRLYLLSIMQGALNPFLYYTILFTAYDLLPAQVAQPLNYTWAITLSIMSAFLLGQRIRPLEIACGVISYAGVLIIVSGGSLHQWASFDPLGVFLALASTVVWSLSWIVNTVDRRDPIESIFLSCAAGLPFITCSCALTTGFPPVDVRGLAGAAYVGMFEMGITFVFWLKTLKFTDTTARVANLVFLSPFASFILIHVLVGERIMPSSLAGLVLIVAGLVLQGRVKS